MAAIQVAQNLLQQPDQISFSALPDRPPVAEGSIQHSHHHETKRHPLGVKPSGNALTSTINLTNAMGAFAILPDALVLLLLEYFDADVLLRIGRTCKALFAYSNYDQLWRDLAIRQSDSFAKWRGDWQASYRGLPRTNVPDIDCSCLFSDALYRPFQCTQLSLTSFVHSIPRSNQIAVLPDLSLSDFSASWTGRPFILTEPVKRWKVFRDWDKDALLCRYAQISFRAEAVDWPLHKYVDYMDNNEDESPLYLFDRAFAEKMDLTVGIDGDYEPPACFGEDLFMLLGDQRPDHRWLIVGPERSGSTFHKDPNATSAWNAVVRGSKYWIMFPNLILPPGVFMSEDQSEVTSPLSIAEWLLTFHEEARNTPGCIEGICGEGEVLHVPSGWWHLVVNLEPAIAITQNFIPRSHIGAAISFLKNKADQVSGFKVDVKDPYALFMSKLQSAYPDLYETYSGSMERKRKWEAVVAEDSAISAEKGGFTFGFDDDSEEYVP